METPGHGLTMLGIAGPPSYKPQVSMRVRHKGVGKSRGREIQGIHGGNAGVIGKKTHLQGSLIKKNTWNAKTPPSKSNRFPEFLTKVCLEIQGVGWLELLVLNRDCTAKKIPPFLQQTPIS